MQNLTILPETREFTRIFRNMRANELSGGLQLVL